MQGRTLTERVLLAVGIAVLMVAPLLAKSWAVAFSIVLLLLALALVHRAAPPPMTRGRGRGAR